MIIIKNLQSNQISALNNPLGIDMPLNKPNQPIYVHIFTILSTRINYNYNLGIFFCFPFNYRPLPTTLNTSRAFQEFLALTDD